MWQGTARKVCKNEGCQADLAEMRSRLKVKKFWDKMNKRTKAPNSGTVWSSLNRIREKLELEVFAASGGQCDFVLMAGRTKSGGKGQDWLITSKGPANEKFLQESLCAESLWRKSVLTTRPVASKKGSRAVDASDVEVAALLKEENLEADCGQLFKPTNAKGIIASELMNWTVQGLVEFGFNRQDVVRLREVLICKAEGGKAKAERRPGPGTARQAAVTRTAGTASPV